MASLYVATKRSETMPEPPPRSLRLHLGKGINTTDTDIQEDCKYMYLRSNYNLSKVVYIS